MFKSKYSNVYFGCSGSNKLILQKFYRKALHLIYKFPKCILFNDFFKDTQIFILFSAFHHLENSPSFYRKSIPIYCGIVSETSLTSNKSAGQQYQKLVLSSITEYRKSQNMCLYEQTCQLNISVYVNIFELIVYFFCCICFPFC